MTGLGFLDLVIGLVFIYFLLSMVVSIIQEIRANIFKLRAENLEQWFIDTLDTKDLGKNLLKHRLIAGLVKKGRKPSYIPNDHFVTALLDILNVDQNAGKPYDINTIKEAVDKTALLPEDLKRYVQQSISEASGEISKVKTDLGNWFDNCMIRVGGTYKNVQQYALIVISFLIVTSFNADSLALTKFLYQNETSRTALATQAASTLQDSTLSLITQKYLDLDSLASGDVELDTEENKVLEDIQMGINDLKAINGQLSDTKLPLGWSLNKGKTNSFPPDLVGWIMKIIGLVISAFAVSLGTPFWFDILNKLVNIRGAGNKPVSKNSVEQ